MREGSDGLHSGFAVGSTKLISPVAVQYAPVEPAEPYREIVLVDGADQTLWKIVRYQPPDRLQRFGLPLPYCPAGAEVALSRQVDNDAEAGVGAYEAFRHIATQFSHIGSADTVVTP